MADSTYVRETDALPVADTTVHPDEEPATKHDVSEGGLLGAVGGAIVGGLAAGPAGAVIGTVGAVIGAVAGGAASAAAVDVVDKHDHDYPGRDMYNNNVYSNSVDDVDDAVIAQDLRTSPVTAYEDSLTSTVPTTVYVQEPIITPASTTYLETPGAVPATDTYLTDPDKEPATTHDVTEGGVIGAVGGAVVGGLAGGPVGAVVGAVAGGAASAGAVDVVDKHDHDYVRTEYPGTAVTGDDPLIDEEDELVVTPAGHRNLI